MYICRAKATITDLPEFVPLMNLNVEANKHLCKHPVVAEALQWGGDVSKYTEIDLVLVADCIYYEEVQNSIHVIATCMKKKEKKKKTMNWAQLL